MANLEKLFLYRMIHIDNMKHIWEFGLTKHDSVNANKLYKPIGDGTLISSRTLFFLPNGNTLGNYIPFYFGKRMPMLYIIQNGYKGVNAVAPENIVYCVTSVQKIIDCNLQYLFSDGHGVNHLSSFFSEDDVSNIENLVDFKAVSDNYWNDDQDLDKKRRKEAEFLVSNDIPKQAIIGFAVYNQSAKDKLIAIGIPGEIVLIKNEFYFQ